jgi:hypothetical protein
LISSESFGAVASVFEVCSRIAMFDEGDSLRVVLPQSIDLAERLESSAASAGRPDRLVEARTAVRKRGWRCRAAPRMTRAGAEP